MSGASLVVEESQRKLRTGAESIAVCLIVKQTFHSKELVLPHSGFCITGERSEILFLSRFSEHCFCPYTDTHEYFNSADFKGINYFKGSLVE